MVPLAHSTTLRNDGALRLLNRTTHVGFQFSALHFAIAMDSVYLAIVVEEHGEVVDAPLHVMVLPRATDIL